jgi:hypothetical protein
VERPLKRAEALEDLRYVGDRRLLPEVAPLLRDGRDAVNVAGSHGPRFIRVCDVAVNVAAALLGNPWPWVAPAKRYSPAEIRELEDALSGLAP